MKKTVATLAGALALLASPLAAEENRSPMPPTKGEKQLAKILKGRVAGEPRSCIRQMPNDRMTVIDDTAIVFGRGNTIYVNYTQRPSRIDDDDVLVFRKFGSGSQLCRTDNITTVDRSFGHYSGNIFLTDFVPYRKVKDKG